jgi:cytochrome c biogenesis protein CcmG/thiol:disulfide interchange protein DsbE
MSRWVSLVPLGLLAAIAIYFAVGLKTDQRTIQSVLIDKPLPAFELARFGGETRINDGELKGKVALLNIFASWCLPCRAEHPVLMKVAQEKRVALYGLAWKNEPGELKEWLDELGNPYEAIAEDRNGRTAIDLGVTGAPETYVLDRKGRIRFKQVGPIDDYIWEHTIEPLVQQLEAEP